MSDDENRRAEFNQWRGRIDSDLATMKASIKKNSDLHDKINLRVWFVLGAVLLGLLKLYLETLTPPGGPQ